MSLTDSDTNASVVLDATVILLPVDVGVVSVNNGCFSKATIHDRRLGRGGEFIL
jgi:hypothetical protein